MIALLAAAALAAPAGFATVGTGVRPLGVPGTELLTGGGARFGLDAGLVDPFVGFAAMYGGVDVEGSTPSGTSLSAQAGVRFEGEGAGKPAHPFATVGALVSRQRGAVVDDDLVQWAEWRALPGIFAGAGAEAPITDRVGVGLEVGGAYLASAVREGDRPESGPTGLDFRASEPLRAMFTYADLHVTFRLGGTP